MIAAIRQLFADLAREQKPPRLGDDELQLAAAALLFHVISIDGVVTEDEKVMLADLLMRRFKIDADGAEELIGAARDADNEAVDLYGFTSLLKRRLDQAEREKLVEMMWKLVFVDGKVHEFEDNLVWRVAELLGVPSQARIRLKQAVRGGSLG